MLYMRTARRRGRAGPALSGLLTRPALRRYPGSPRGPPPRQQHSTPSVRMLGREQPPQKCHDFLSTNLAVRYRRGQPQRGPRPAEHRSPERPQGTWSEKRVPRSPSRLTGSTAGGSGPAAGNRVRGLGWTGRRRLGQAEETRRRGGGAGVGRGVSSWAGAACLSSVQTRPHWFLRLPCKRCAFRSSHQGCE